MEIVKRESPITYTFVDNTIISEENVASTDYYKAGFPITAKSGMVNILQEFSNSTSLKSECGSYESNFIDYSLLTAEQIVSGNQNILVSRISSGDEGYKVIDLYLHNNVVNGKNVVEVLQTIPSFKLAKPTSSYSKNESVLSESVNDYSFEVITDNDKVIKEVKTSNVYEYKFYDIDNNVIYRINPYELNNTAEKLQTAYSGKITYIPASFNTITTLDSNATSYFCTLVKTGGILNGKLVSDDGIVSIYSSTTSTATETTVITLKREKTFEVVGANKQITFKNFYTEKVTTIATNNVKREKVLVGSEAVYTIADNVDVTTDANIYAVAPTKVSFSSYTEKTITTSAEVLVDASNTNTYPLKYLLSIQTLKPTNFVEFKVLISALKVTEIDNIVLSSKLNKDIVKANFFKLTITDANGTFLENPFICSIVPGYTDNNKNDYYIRNVINFKSNFIYITGIANNNNGFILNNLSQNEFIFTNTSNYTKTKLLTLDSNLDIINNVYSTPSSFNNFVECKYFMFENDYDISNNNIFKQMYNVNNKYLPNETQLLEFNYPSKTITLNNTFNVTIDSVKFTSETTKVNDIEYFINTNGSNIVITTKDCSAFAYSTVTKFVKSVSGTSNYYTITFDNTKDIYTDLFAYSKGSSSVNADGLNLLNTLTNDFIDNTNIAGLTVTALLNDTEKLLKLAFVFDNNTTPEFEDILSNLYVGSKCLINIDPVNNLADLGIDVEALTTNEDIIKYDITPSYIDMSINVDFKSIKLNNAEINNVEDNASVNLSNGLKPFEARLENNLILADITELVNSNDIIIVKDANGIVTDLYISSPIYILLKASDNAGLNTITDISEKITYLGNYFNGIIDPSALSINNLAGFIEINSNVNVIDNKILFSKNPTSFNVVLTNEKQLSINNFTSQYVLKNFNNKSLDANVNPYNGAKLLNVYSNGMLKGLSIFEWLFKSKNVQTFFVLDPIIKTESIWKTVQESLLSLSNIRENISTITYSKNFNMYDIYEVSEKYYSTGVLDENRKLSISYNETNFNNATYGGWINTVLNDNTSIIAPNLGNYVKRWLSYLKNDPVLFPGGVDASNLVPENIITVPDEEEWELFDKLRINMPANINGYGKYLWGDYTNYTRLSDLNKVRNKWILIYLINEFYPVIIPYIKKPLQSIGSTVNNVTRLKNGLYNVLSNVKKGFALEPSLSLISTAEELNKGKIYFKLTLYFVDQIESVEVKFVFENVGNFYFEVLN